MKITKTEVTVDKIVENSYKENEDQAQLRQQIIKSYPSSNGGANDRQDSLMDSDDFGEGKTFTENRVVFIPVPKGTTKEQAEAALKKYDSPCIKRVLATEPIMTSSDIGFLNSLSDEDYQDAEERIHNSQIINDENGEIVTDTYGRTMYRRLFFSQENVEDEDQRKSPVNIGTAQPAEEKQQTVLEKHRAEA